MASFLTVPAEGSSLSRYLEEIRRFPMLEPEEEFMLAKSWQEQGDSEAAHRLVTSHLRLVAKIAMGYRGYGLPLNEIISEGNVGLMQAVKRFDPDRGFRLATYAMWWIRAAIQEYILHSWSLVKMGTTAAQKKLFFNLRKLKGQMQAIDEGDLRARDGEGDRRAARRHRERGDRDEPAAGGRRPLAQRAAPGRQRHRLAGLAGRREPRARRPLSPRPTSSTTGCRCCTGR